MSSPKKPLSQEPSFEEALQTLEALIQKMEQGDVPLADLIHTYEKGSEILNICEKHLESAELRLLQIKKGQLELLDA